MEQLLPFRGSGSDPRRANWDYLYEPEAKIVLEAGAHALHRGDHLPGVAEEHSSEQSARMVAMKVRLR